MRDWNGICAKCADGEIEPTFCEYYGEPNGCNSPTYHEHPPVGNAAAMREALESCMDYLWRVDHPMNEYMRGLFETAYNKTMAALAAPARNCDLFLSLAEMYSELRNHPKDAQGRIIGVEISTEAWLFDQAEKGGAE